MITRVRRYVGLVAAASLMASSSIAVAASTPTPQQVSPWATLSALSGGASAAALCGAAAAGQAAAPGCVLPATDAAPPAVAIEQPIPVPPPEVGSSGLAFNPLFLALGAVAAAALIYFLVKGKDNDDDEPVSPA